ncbi:hypothetical protein BWQ96_08086 [Gracilariopsis chorda]|uniref:DUF3119 family protein n=1 Tax=Gracilariopsis chorda TaxID=448386 RepID=A0A2V3IJ92_9FLOR|nr:hypothetical protein BWQ96_08086 [Gracilariopsis chorda]|eukprot:PXF42166.1 hypothetical protein BWQ96_08086 [Gracilariopsis chorda]
MTAKAFVPCIPLTVKSTYQLCRTVPSRRLSLSQRKVPQRSVIVAEATNEPPPPPGTADEQTETTFILEEEALDPGSDTVVVPGSFNLAAFFMFSGGLCVYLGDGWLVPGFPILLVGILLSVQSTRIRIVFGPTRLSVARITGSGLELIRGWKYKDITNWEFWWKRLPVLVYFKEKESYYGRGSIHFFPILTKGDVLLEQFIKRTPHLDKSQYK